MARFAGREGHRNGRHFLQPGRPIAELGPHQLKGEKLYAYWTRTSNQTNANYRFGVNVLNVAVTERGANPSAFALGMLCDF